MLHPELRQNSDRELSLRQNWWIPYLHLSSAPGKPPLRRSEGLFHDEGSISAVKICRRRFEPCQTHVATSSRISKPRSQFPLCSSFLFSFSHNLSVCLFVKCRIKYLLACSWLRHLFLRGKELCATVLQKEEHKTNPGALANRELSWLNLHNRSEFLFVLWQQTPYILSFFSSTSHEHYILQQTVIQHYPLVCVSSSHH